MVPKDNMKIPNDTNDNPIISREQNKVKKFHLSQTLPFSL
jgi:hypothetical protein